jgi:hypothetical protein
MVEHQANLFYWATYHLHSLQRMIKDAMSDPERGDTALPNKVEADTTKRVLRRIANCCDPIEFESVLTRMTVSFNLSEPLLQPFAAKGQPVTLIRLSFELEELSKEIAKVLGTHTFALIPAQDVPFYDNSALFGFEVAARFPKANKEITKAGTCYVAGCYEACVFHLMRAVELGVRRMIKKLGVQQHLLKNGNRIPVELCDWHLLIVALDKGVNALSHGSATNKRKKDTFEFYNHALGSIRNFKDAWRNNVMHMRTPYDQHQAISVVENTRQFMQHLARRLSE